MTALGRDSFPLARGPPSSPSDGNLPDLPPSSLHISRKLSEVGGEEGIRTPGTREGSTVFKTTAIDHSATSPRVPFYCFIRRRHPSCGIAESAELRGKIRCANRYCDHDLGELSPAAAIHLKTEPSEGAPRWPIPASRNCRKSTPKAGTGAEARPGPRRPRPLHRLALRREQGRQTRQEVRQLEGSQRAVRVPAWRQGRSFPDGTRALPA